MATGLLTIGQPQGFEGGSGGDRVGGVDEVERGAEDPREDITELLPRCIHAGWRHKPPLSQSCFCSHPKPALAAIPLDGLVDRAGAASLPCSAPSSSLPAAAQLFAQVLPFPAWDRHSLLSAHFQGGSLLNHSLRLRCCGPDHLSLSLDSPGKWLSGGSIWS